MDADTTYEGAEPFQIVARGYGGRLNAGYHFVINRVEHDPRPASRCSHHDLLLRQPCCVAARFT